MLISVIYRSRATYPAPHASDMRIIAQSRANNVKAQINGFLARTAEHFFQVLEGDPDVVDPLLDRIAADPRNSELTILCREEVGFRRFTGWSMGYSQLAAHTPGTQAFFQDAVISEAIRDSLLGFAQTHGVLPPPSRNPFLN